MIVFGILCYDSYQQPGFLVGLSQSRILAYVFFYYLYNCLLFVLLNYKGSKLTD